MFSYDSYISNPTIPVVNSWQTMERMANAKKISTHGMEPFDPRPTSVLDHTALYNFAYVMYYFGETINEACSNNQMTMHFHIGNVITFCDGLTASNHHPEYHLTPRSKPSKPPATSKDPQHHQPRFLPFDRITLSNVPDYTGLTSVFTSCMPLLNHANHATLVEFSTRLLSLWYPSIEEYVYGHSLVAVKDLASVYGVRFIQGNQPAVDAFHWFGPAYELVPPSKPGGLDAVYDFDRKSSMSCSAFQALQPPRAQIQGFLMQLFVHITQPPARAMLRANSNHCAPLTLAAFFRVLVHLTDYVRVPQHWISAFVTRLLHGPSTPSSAMLRKLLPASFQPSRTVVPQAQSMAAERDDYSTAAFAAEMASLATIWLATRFSPIWPIEMSLPEQLPVRLRLTSPCCNWLESPIGPFSANALGLCIVRTNTAFTGTMPPMWKQYFEEANIPIEWSLNLLPTAGPQSPERLRDTFRGGPVKELLLLPGVDCISTLRYNVGTGEAVFFYPYAAWEELQAHEGDVKVFLFRSDGYVPVAFPHDLQKVTVTELEALRRKRHPAAGSSLAMHLLN